MANANLCVSAVRTTTTPACLTLSRACGQTHTNTHRTVHTCLDNARLTCVATSYTAAALVRFRRTFRTLRGFGGMEMSHSAQGHLRSVTAEPLSHICIGDSPGCLVTLVQSVCWWCALGEPARELTPNCRKVWGALTRALRIQHCCVDVSCCNFS